MKEIRFYRATGPFAYMSNLYPSRVVIDGVIFPTAEHAYQWAKPRDALVREWVRQAPFGRFAAVAGHHLPIYDVAPGWKNAKLDRMRAVVRAKFEQNPNLRELLLATGEARIVEGSRDAFWGEGWDGGGQNWLGRVLMEVREKLRAGSR